MNGSLLQPSDLAEKCGIKKSTLNSYLNDLQAFPPAKIDDDNRYRYYDEGMIPRLKLFKALRKKPFRFTLNEAKDLLKKHNVEELINYHSKSNDVLYAFLRDKGWL